MKACYLYRLFFICCLFIFFTTALQAQNVVRAAQKFIAALDTAQRRQAVYSFDSEERYNFHFFPKTDRKGISLNELNATQKEAARSLMQTCLSPQAMQKTAAIMQLEGVLKEMEKRAPDDHHRDTGKYYFTIFGQPGKGNIWGWRLEGHHVSFNFSANKNKLVSGTPGFLGTNPAIVLDGPKKGTQVLKEEADGGFALLHSLSKEAQQKAIMDSIAPNDIVTFITRKVLMERPMGLRYTDMTPAQQKELRQLVTLYIHRYTKLFANAMLKEIEAAGWDNMWFAWAGATEPVIGKAHYYRIQGPTVIIEYDNAQNNANHVHTVVRDLKNDFGGDVLLEHYKKNHHNR